MSKIETFLSNSEEQDIIEAIRLAELNTSGEIRVHIEATANGNANTRALDVFYSLKMNNTKLQNAVLIYVAIDDKTFVIYGDNGINKCVPENFWDSTKQVIEAYFKKGLFKQGLVAGITKCGEQLKHYFPYSALDENELTNEISKG